MAATLNQPTTFADRLGAIFDKAGIPTHERKVYGMQAHFNVAKENKARAIEVMVQAGFRYRGEVDSPITMMSKRRVGTTLYFVLEG